MVHEIISKITKESKIENVIFVGCGASQADLYPAVYFLRENAQKLSVSHYVANEFNYAPPKNLGENTLVITASLGGTTPETVSATKKAVAANARVIALTNKKDSPLDQESEFTIVHKFFESYGEKLEKMQYALQIAVEILHQVEGYDHYDEMIEGFNKITTVVNDLVPMVSKKAKGFAEKFKKDEVIYVMASGATEKVAYSTAACLWMEMQWINSGSYNTGEFFHGPFEIVEEGVPFVLFMNEGKTRPMDERALDFLLRFDAKVEVIDAKDFALGNYFSAHVIDYFNPIFLSGIFRNYAEELSYVRQHPLSTRRYMWKLEY